jgi:hypothetical protein
VGHDGVDATVMSNDLIFPFKDTLILQNRKNVRTKVVLNLPATFG